MFRSLLVSFIFCINSYASTEFPVSFLQKLKLMPEEYVVLNVWSPFCAPCVAEVQELNNAVNTANKNKRSLAVIGAALQGRPKEIQAFLEHFNVAYEQITLNTELKSFFDKNPTVPRTLIFNKERILVKEFFGSITAKQILDEMKNSKL